MRVVFNQKSNTNQILNDPQMFTEGHVLSINLPQWDNVGSTFDNALINYYVAAIPFSVTLPAGLYQDLSSIITQWNILFAGVITLGESNGHATITPVVGNITFPESTFLLETMLGFTTSDLTGLIAGTTVTGSNMVAILPQTSFIITCNRAESNQLVAIDGDFQWIGSYVIPLTGIMALFPTSRSYDYQSRDAKLNIPPGTIGGSWNWGVLVTCVDGGLYNVQFGSNTYPSITMQFD